MEASQKDQLATTSRSGALAAPAGPVHDVEELARALTDWQRTANVLSPLAAVDHIMPLHQVSLRVVTIDASIDPQSGNGPECYRDPRFCKAGEVALGKNALAKIMGAAGVQIVSRRRLDDHSDPYYCEVEVVLAMQDFDGTYRQIIATKEMDLRAGAPETMKPEKDRQGTKTGRLVAYDDSALADKRRHIQSHAETKAIERGIRLLFSLRQKYSLEDLKKPFVVPKLVGALDPSDPGDREALRQHALGNQMALYGPQPAGRQVRTLKAVNEEEPIDLGAMPEAPPAPVAPELPPELPPEEPTPPPCTLPIAEETLTAAVQTGDGKRAEFLKAINSWCAHALRHMPPDAAGTIFQKLGVGFDPLTASTAEMAGLIGALKAEIAKVSA